MNQTNEMEEWRKQDRSHGQLKLNVVLVTYNHALYIEECVKSILMQKTDFKFNVIVADDKSTDNNVDIIRKCASGSNIEFIYLEDQENLGINKNYIRAHNACNAEYVAFMEGDDFWTDTKRLQKHVDFLDNHLECTMSFNGFIAADYENAIFTANLEPLSDISESFTYLRIEDILNQGGPGYSTCVYRKSVLDKLRNDYFDNNIRSDWTLSIMAATCGLVAFQNEIMNVYRLHSGGLWTSLDTKQKTEQILLILDKMDIYTDKRFSDLFSIVKGNSKPLFSIPSLSPKMQRAIKYILIITWKFTPPIAIWILKALTPPIIWNRLERITNKEALKHERVNR